MPQACSRAQATDRFGIVLDFVTKLGNGSISEDEAKKFLRGECRVSPATEQAPTRMPLLTVVATTSLGAVSEKKTGKCFASSRYYHRDPNFDNWLPANQPSAPACTISTLAPSKEWTFIEAAQAVLGVSTTDIVELGRLLIEQGHTMTLNQVEEMVEATERHEETGIRTNGYGNFFFVETGNPNDPVSVAYVRRNGRWCADVRRLGSSTRLLAECRFLVRNLLTL